MRNKAVIATKSAENNVSFLGCIKPGGYNWPTLHKTQVLYRGLLYKAPGMRPFGVWMVS